MPGKAVVKLAQQQSMRHGTDAVAMGRACVCRCRLRSGSAFSDWSFLADFVEKVTSDGFEAFSQGVLS